MRTGRAGKADLKVYNTIAMHGEDKEKNWDLAK